MKFGEKVRKARLAAKYSQKQLAEMTGIALRTIQNYESGERMPKQKETYPLLADALGIEVSSLMDDNADFHRSGRTAYTFLFCRARWTLRNTGYFFPAWDQGFH